MVMEFAFSLKNISFRYSKKRPEVLHDISFDVTPGTIFGLLGPSGAGKSTTQKLMSKLLATMMAKSCISARISALQQIVLEDIGVGFEMPVISIN
jgi:fluoroquinolone transport system ATP-binding protein